MENKTVSYDRLLDIFITFLDESLYETSPEWIKEKLELICTDEELEELDLKEWLWGQDEIDEDPYDELPEEGPEFIDEDIPDENSKLNNNSSLTYQVLYKKAGQTNVGYTDILGDALSFVHNDGITDYCVYNQKEKIPVESK